LEKKIQSALIAIEGRKYTAIINSTKNSRGVAVLIACDLTYTVNDIKRDTQENILVANVTINNSPITIAAIYGPNKTEPIFYENLRNYLSQSEGSTIIMGGDWNTLWLSEDPNIEAFNMAGFPNRIHAGMLAEIAENFELSDPFRILNPTKLDYTYIPFGNTRQNRSRLDFFVVSNNLLNSVKSCRSSDSLLTKMFDHKSVSLFLGKIDNPVILPPHLKNTDLDHPLLVSSVTVAAYKTTILALDTANNPQNLLLFNQNIALIRQLEQMNINLAASLINDSKQGLNTRETEEHFTFHVAGIDEITARLSNYSELQNCAFRCNRTILFEMIAEYVKKAAIRAQNTLGKCRTIRKRALCVKKKDLEENFAANINDIKKIESELTKMSDEKYKTKMQDKKIYDILNTEKAMPSFLSLSKINTTEPTLDCLKNNNGEDFETQEDLHAHVLNFYSSLYRLDQAVQGEIEDFLGPEISAHPMVLGNKLTDLEKNILDRDLTMEELENALNDSNLKSAPGIDGYSYRFIKAFWRFFKTPLFLCAKSGLDEDALPEVFKSAQIKLIPKKGDPTKIKNWRPISLLSNFYKIISRAINNRLKKVSDRILSRSQKGFCQSRVIQEAVFNILDTIEYCNNTNIPGALVAIDQAKAFDSVSHEYMDKVLAFFGFGNRFRQWIKTIGTGRKARIILGPGKHTEFFDLEKGRAQGDSPSPLLYNFAAQILLFKIELDPAIPSIRQQQLRPGPIIPLGSRFENESNRETDKSDSFADDNSVMTTPSLSSLSALKRILNDFRLVSGLSTNFEKTSIMFIGPTVPPPLEVVELGFEIVDKVKILGFEITNNRADITENFDTAIEKITKILQFWSRFYLSLHGKIMVYKTLILPQIAYYATIINPTEEQISQINSRIENFVMKAEKISKRNLYLPVTEGGYGLFDIYTYIQGLRLGFLKRALTNTNDNWKFDFVTNYTDVFTGTGTNEVEGNAGFYQNSLYQSAIRYTNAYYNSGANFITTPIKNNTAIQYFERQFGALVPVQEEQEDRLNQLTFKDIMVGKDLVSFDNFRWHTGIEINRTSYNKIKNGFEVLTKKAGNFWAMLDTTRTRDAKENLRACKKPGKMLRNLIEKQEDQSRLLNQARLKSYLKIIAETDSVPVISTSRARSLLSGWDFKYLPSELRTFVLKFYSNTLGLASRVAHFNQEVDQRCTFCILKNLNPANRESFVHLFFNCPVTKKCLDIIFRTCFETETPHQEKVFLCNFSDQEEKNIPIQTVLDIARYLIWKCKIAKKLPNSTLIIEEINFLLGAIFKVSPKLRQKFVNCDVFQERDREPISP